MRPFTQKFHGCLLALLLSPICLCAAGDWLIDPAPFVASVTLRADGREVELANGLVRRVIRLRPDAATIALDDLMTGQSLLRSVQPEAQVELDGKRFDVGGLAGQPIDNYLSPSWLDQLTAEPSAFHFTGMKTGRTEAR